MCVFAFSQPYNREMMVGVAPEHEVVRFGKVATQLFTMFDLPLWNLIRIVTCACFVLLLLAHVD